MTEAGLFPTRMTFNVGVTPFSLSSFTRNLKVLRFFLIIGDAFNSSVTKAPLKFYLYHNLKHCLFTKEKKTRSILSIDIWGVSVGFYLGLAMQLIGFSSVGLCLYAGMLKGDYGHLELVQFIGGSAVFYIGSVIKSRSGR